jgi:hypothetical protein
MNLNLVDPWMLIKASDTMTVNLEAMPQLETLCPIFLNWLSARDWQLPHSFWPLPVLDGLLQSLYGERELPANVGFLRHNVEHRIFGWGHNQLCLKLLGAVFCELSRNTLNVEKTANSPLHPHFDGILLRTELLLKRLKKDRWYVPELKDLNISFAENKTPVFTAHEQGWVISQPDWVNLYGAWTERFAPKV